MINAVREILNSCIKEDDLIISSTGMPSRVLYHVNDSSRNFYVQGSMGASLGIGIGLALNTKRNVHVIAGDGDILMSLGTLVLMKKLNLNNLFLHVLDNNSYMSTGGQKTCSDAISFYKMSNNVREYIVSNEKPNVGRIKLKDNEITKRFYNEINVSGK